MRRIPCKLYLIGITVFWLLLPSMQIWGQSYGLPAGARVIETQSLKEQGYPNRALLLWMKKPEKHSRDDDDAYTCPEETRGSFFRGPTRVSLLDLARGRIINTIKIRQSFDGADAFDLPFRIHAGSYYHVPGVAEGKEGKPKLIRLKDYNGDGSAREFALFDAEYCMGLATTLLGYSVRQDRVIQYPVHLRVQGEGKRRHIVSPWCDYLFSLPPCAPGFWKYEIDYRGRGGALDQYVIKYNAAKERFEGQLKWRTESPTFIPYYMEPRRCF